MAEVVEFSKARSIRDEAERWLVKLDGDAFSAADGEAFREWLRASPEHRQAIRALVVLWNDLDILSELSDLFPLTPRPTQKTTPRLPGRWIVPAAAAAVIAAIALGVGMIYSVGRDPRPDIAIVAGATELHTAVGQTAVFDLGDGSRVTLNTDSVVEVAFDASQRNLRLVQGEAHFQVAHDPDRAFVVHAGTGIVRAVGTAFGVRLKDEGVEVSVTEGTVLVASGVSARADRFVALDEIELRDIATAVRAGQSIAYGHEAVSRLETLPPDRLARKLAWQSGMLMFEGETLAEAVAEISRYTDTEIVIADPAIRGIPIGGYFRTGEVDALLAVLEDSFSIQVNRIHPNLVYLSGAATTP
jgi:transmembrane sensor